MNLSRRAALRGSLLAGTALALAACSTGLTAAQIAAQTVTDAKLLANGFSGVLAGLQTLHDIPAASATIVTSALSSALAIAQSISSSMTTAAAQPLVTQIETDFSAALSALSVVTLPTPISGIIAAIQVVLPLVETAVGLITGVSVVETPSMSPAKARAVLAHA